MRTTSILTVLFFSGLALINMSCQNEKKEIAIKLDTAKEAEQLMQTSREWSAAAQSRDIEKTLDYWADDAVLYSCNQAPLKGKEAIRQMVEGSLNDPNFSISWEPVSAEVSENGDMGYLLEKSTITMTDSTGVSTPMHLNSVTIWKKQADGSWKNVVDVMGSNQ